MGTVNLRQAREKLRDLIDAAERGESTLITRRGKKAARIGPVEGPGERQLPDLSAFRATVEIRGAKLSRTVVGQRQKERY